MPANGFNIGRDVTIDVVAGGALLRSTIRTGFSSKQMTTSLEVKAADGRMLFAELPAGWEGTLEYERGNSALDDFFAQQEANYFGGIASPVISITETISEVSGAVTQYRYTGVAMKFDDAGSKGGDATVKQKAAWKAARRIKVA